MAKILNNIRIWGLLLFIALTLIIFLPAFLEYRSTKKDLVKLWQDQSRLVAETIVRGSRTMMRFDDQRLRQQKDRLLNDGFTLRQLDSLNFPDVRPALTFSRRRLHARLWFFSPAKEPIVPEVAGKRPLRRPGRIPDFVIRALQSFPPDSVVSLLLPEQFQQPAPPMLIVRRAQNRGFMVALIRPAPGDRLRRFHVFKKWLNELVTAPDILYVQLLKNKRPVVQAGDLTRAPAQPPANFLNLTPAWEIINTSDKTIFDYWQPAPGGMTIRIGLSTQALAHLQKNLVRRLVLNSILLLVFGFLALRFILNRQNIAFLQKRLNQMEIYTVSILKNMSDGILAFNSNHEIEFHNSAFGELTGVTDFNTLDSAIAFLPEHLKDKIKRFTAFENASLELNRRFLLISGKHVNLDKSAESYERIYLLIVRDFTTQKELNEIRTRRSKLMAMGELASRVAHEIRNPLNGIAMLAQRLQKEFKPEQNDAEFRQMTSAIRRETERLNQIVHSFLFYARVPQMKFQPTRFSEYLLDLKAILQACGQSTLKIEVKKEAVVSLDHDQFKQALVNLIKNAMESSPPEKPVELILDAVNDRALLIIEDQGPGIDEELKDKIFDLYFTTKEQGAGIGLSVVEKIIEAHGGKIRFESPYLKQGQTVKGTRFIIELPLQNRKGKQT